jgi:hypothetical protein
MVMIIIFILDIVYDEGMIRKMRMMRGMIRKMMLMMVLVMMLLLYDDDNSGTFFSYQSK